MAAMRYWIFLICVPGLLSTAGCHGKASGSQKPVAKSRIGADSARDKKLIVTANTALVGRVSVVNANGRFAVITFPIGKMPAAEQPLYVYRRGLRTGELRATNQRIDVNIVADITAGDAQEGDEVRDN